MNHKHEIITEDEETDINVDDDDPYEKTFASKASSVSFSISNILSDSFGPKPVKLEENENPNGKTIFRPFELKNFISNSASNVKPFVQNPSSIFLSNFRLSDVFDYSTKHASPRSESDNNLRNSLYNSLSAYPKIHEEILNSHKKNPNIQTTSNYRAASSIIPPLGGLCKTISQIGQENVTQSSKSPDKSTLKASLDSIKIQQSPAESVDSDDCTSEASTSKDESQKMWPAWVSEESMLVHGKLTYYVFSPFAQIFCTRYSDRPSSGKRKKTT